jgi:hypothetical protein
VPSLEASFAAAGWVAFAFGFYPAWSLDLAVKFHTGPYHIGRSDWFSADVDGGGTNRHVIDVLNDLLQFTLVKKDGHGI